MLPPESPDDFTRELARIADQEEALQRQRKALEAQQRTWAMENPGALRRNKSQYSLGPRRQVMADAIYEVLKEGSPLTRRAILNRIVENGFLTEEINPLKRISEMLTADERFEKVPEQRGYWTLSDFCRNGLQGKVQLNQEIHTQNETDEGCHPSSAPTKREDESQMATSNATIERQVETHEIPKVTTPAFVTALGPDDPDDGDRGRQQRGRAIAYLSTIKKTLVGYSVPSQSGNGRYVVNEEVTKCECPDFELRNKDCKHIEAVKEFQLWEANPDEKPELTPIRKRDLETETVAKKPNCDRDWALYNKAQVLQTPIFKKLLRQLCDTIPEAPKGIGRPRFPQSERVFSLAMKVYSTKATREATDDLQVAIRDGLMEKAPDFSSITRWMESPELTPVLVALIEQSALPFADLEEVEETIFAADSSGFTVAPYERWFDYKYGSPKKRGKFAKAHITCGVVSKIITAAVVTPGESSDSKQAPAMIKTTARNFTIQEFSGDKAYLSRENVSLVARAGGTPYFPPKKNSVARNKRHKQDEKMDAWERMFHSFHANPEKWLDQYHKRSNVETCFWMVKSKVREHVRSKTPTARVNEVYTKLLCHNLIVLAHKIVEFGIDPIFMNERGQEEEWESMQMAA